MRVAIRVIVVKFRRNGRSAGSGGYAKEVFYSVIFLQFGLALMGMQGAFSGFPGYSGPSLMILGLDTHNVKVSIGKEFSTVTSVSRIKNYGNVAGQITVLIPNNVRGASSSEMLLGIMAGNVTATWDGQPLTLTPSAVRESEISKDDLISFDGLLNASANVKPNGTHTITISYTNTLQSLITKDLLTFAYDTRLASTWRRGPIKQVDISLKYERLTDGQSAVFSVERLWPEGWKWGMGEGLGQQGAYFGAKNFLNGSTPNDRQPLVFTYYAGGY